MSTHTLASRFGLRKASTDTAFEARVKLAKNLLTRQSLTEFQRGFLLTMSTQRTLSRRQEEIWRDMVAKCGR